MATFAATNETELAVFEAALRVFAHKGKDGARMQEIADEAGINKAMLHYYFRSKDLLYASVFEHVLDHFFSAMDEVMNRKQAFRETLKSMIDVYLTEHAEHPEVYRLWLHENLNGAPVATELLKKRMVDSSVAGPLKVMERIQSAVDTGEIRPMNPIQLMISILGMTVMYFIGMPSFSSLSPALVEDPELSLEERKQHVFDVLYNGIST